MNTGKRRERRDLLAVAAVALLVRVAVVAWAAHRFAPTGDGHFYHVIAQRIAAGQGYTWLWPDGVVTYAAHYPVGYPAMIGLVYWLIGPRPWGAMLLNGVLGVLGTVAVHRLALEVGTRRGALLAALVAALHPALVAYVPALMTEGATAWLLVIAAALVLQARSKQGGVHAALLVGASAVLALAALIRPQSLMFVPVFGWLSAGAHRAWKQRLRNALGALAVVAVLCAPWVVRNRVRMDHAALSFNGGWNLLIGTDASAKGTWAPLQVPEACRLVFHEAKKDACFGKEAARRIRENAAAWLALVPQKLSQTFDYCGAAGWYLHASNAQAMPYAWKVRLGVVETLWQRVLLIGALLLAGLAKGPRRRVRLTVALAGVVAALSPYGFVAYVLLALLLAVGGGAGVRAPLAVSACCWVIAGTVLTHAVFFGAGRYGMVVFPFVAGLAAGYASGRGFDRLQEPGDTARRCCGARSTREPKGVQDAYH